MSVSRTHRSAVTQDVVGTGPAELAGTWEFDPAHTRLGFLAPQMMVTTIRGTFGEVVGGATLDPANPQNCGMSVTIQANSINTGSPRRDAHLRSAAYFEVEKYPTIEFRSSELRPTKAPEVWTVAGDLTIRGITRPVELTMTYLGVSGDPSGGTVRADALALAQSDRLIRVFTDERAPLAALLRSWVSPGPDARSGTTSAQVRQQVSRILQAFDAGTPAVGQPSPVAGLVEELTRRELEVLRLISTGLHNREIAQALFVTLDTVKKHISHILSKLGATSRTHAVARARDGGLIP
jgi:polyisoprenoid-binding protein YceI/DNA-binding CsgD family transcriptional regulator